MRPTRTIVVAGAGIGGLTAALALARANFRVVVLERASELTDIGAGIQLTPNAGRILAGLGLEDALAAICVEPDTIDVRLGQTGKLVASLPLAGAFRERHRFHYRVAHRADVIDVLAAAARDHDDIELHLGATSREFAAHANGITTLAEVNGRSLEFRGSALIGADGINSHIRAAMPKAKAAVPSGRTAWRTTIPAEEAPEAIRTNSVGLWLGQKAHLVHYPLSGGREINIVAIVDEAIPFDGWSVPGHPDAIAARFADWSHTVRAIIAAPTHWLKWRLDTVDPTGRWVAGPVALLGDAAHAMLPFLAQGAAMAIEDAAVLTAELSHRPEDASAALERYARVRKKRVLQVWRAARGNGHLYHMGGISAGVRDIGMRVLGGDRLLRRYDWLYGWQPA